MTGRLTRSRPFPSLLMDAKTHVSLSDYVPVAVASVFTSVAAAADPIVKEQNRLANMSTSPTMLPGTSVGGGE